MSKSLGNVVNPYSLVEKYGTDATRYYLLAKIHPYKDSDFTYEKFIRTYNDDLANGIGNLTARIIRLLQINNFKIDLKNKFNPSLEIKKCIDRFRFDQAMEYIWEKITELDRYINRESPWKKDCNNVDQVMQTIAKKLSQISIDLLPFLPYTSKAISEQLAINNNKPFAPLFPKIEMDNQL